MEDFLTREQVLKEFRAREPKLASMPDEELMKQVGRSSPTIIRHLIQAGDTDAQRFFPTNEQITSDVSNKPDDIRRLSPQGNSLMSEYAPGPKASLPPTSALQVKTGLQIPTFTKPQQTVKINPSIVTTPQSNVISSAQKLPLKQSPIGDNLYDPQKVSTSFSTVVSSSPPNNKLEVKEMPIQQSLDTQSDLDPYSRISQYDDRKKRFQMPQFRTASPQMNEAQSQAMQTPASNDIYSGAKQGVEKQVNAALPSDGEEDVSPYTNMDKEPSTQSPELQTGINPYTAKAAEYAQQAPNFGKTDVETSRKLLDQSTDAVTKAAQYDPSQYKPSKLRKTAAISAGIATGILGGGPLKGYDTYKQIARSPALEKQAQLNKEAAAAGTNLKAADDVSKNAQAYGSELNKSAGVMQNVGQDVQNAPKVRAETGKAIADTAKANAEVGKIPSDITLNKANADKAEAEAFKLRHPETDWEMKAGSVDGKNVNGYYDKKNRKVVDSDGKDITAKFVPKENQSSSDDKDFEAYQKRFPGKDRWDYLTDKAKLSPQASFNINNPTASEEEVQHIADQIDADSTGTLFTKLTAGNKKLQEQIRKELAYRDSDLSILSPATRQIAEKSHELMPSFDEAIKKLSDPKLKDKMATLGSRWQDFKKGTFGKGDKDYTELATLIGFLQTGIMQAHVGSRGSGQMLDKFTKMINADKMDAPTLTDALQETKTFLKRYENAVYGKNTSQTTPRVGQVEHGYKFKGGDPSKQENWEKQ